MNINSSNEYLSTFDEQGRFSGCVWGHREYVLEPTGKAWPHTAVYGKYDDTWRTYKGQVCKRLVCPVVVEGLTLRGVRPGSTITIEGKQYESAEGGDVELSFQYPGTYEITITCWPDLDGRYTVENLPAD